MDIVKIDPQQYFCALRPDHNVKNATPGFTYLMAVLVMFDGQSLSLQELDSPSGEVNDQRSKQRVAEPDMVGLQFDFDKYLSDRMLDELRRGGYREFRHVLKTERMYVIHVGTINRQTQQLELQVSEESVDYDSFR